MWSERKNSHLPLARRNEEKMERESTWHIELGCGDAISSDTIEYFVMWSRLLCALAHTHTQILLINFLIQTVSSVNLFNFRCQFVPVLLNKIYFLFKFASVGHTFAINLYVAGSFFLCIYAFMWCNWIKNGSVNHVYVWCVAARCCADAFTDSMEKRNVFLSFQSLVGIYCCVLRHTYRLFAFTRSHRNKLIFFYSSILLLWQSSMSSDQPCLRCFESLLNWYLRRK